MRILHADIHLIDLETRLPFKYGIATMTSAPHAFVRVQLELDGEEESGVAADHLPPKWFTKLPEKPLDEEIDEMLASIEHAVQACIGLEGESVYGIWQQLSALQETWGREQSFPPLLSNFGTTLVERALIEAAGLIAGEPFPKLLRDNLFGIRLGDFDERLQGVQPAGLLPQPREQVIARHTVGMADPLTDGEIAPDERLDDGLPQSLAECISRYGLLHFKIKVSGNIEQDVERVTRIAEVIRENASADFAFSMDGNEQFRTLDAFREFWETLTGTERLQEFFGRLMFVEQPFHRDVALDERVLGELRNWSGRPTLIIDESDSEHDSLAKALELGYHGTSHKNCKGVFRGIANACLLEKLRREDGTATYVMSGEDLANIGPVALLQDLAVSATLGVESIERNGHHYFAGLLAFPESVQQDMLDTHADLYHVSEQGWPTLNIQDGRLDLRSVLRSTFGVGFPLDVEQFNTVDEWRKQRKEEQT